MKRAWVVLVLATAPLTVSFANAACAGPRLSLPDHVAPGEVVVVTGDGFFTECRDVVGPCQKPGTFGSYEEVRLVARQGDTRIVVAAVRPDGQDFLVSVKIPPELHPGRATLLAFDAATDRRIARQHFRVS